MVREVRLNNPESLPGRPAAGRITVNLLEIGRTEGATIRAPRGLSRSPAGTEMSFTCCPP